MEAHAFPEAGQLTISQGVITMHGSPAYKSIYTQVDNALYQAKATGRNRVVQAQFLR